MTEKISLSAPSPGEQGYVPPADTVPLPSLGRVYPTGHPLHGAESVQIRSMTAKDEDILTSRALLKAGKAISTLLRSCLIDKSIDPDDMVVGDRNAVLIAIRITGYGPEYQVQVDCPKCEEKARHEFRLDQLEVKRLARDPIEIGRNGFSFTAPSGQSMVFKLLTGRDETDIAQSLERNKKLGLPESMVTTRLQYSLASIGSERDGAKLAAAVRALPARDSKALRNQIEEASPGILMVQSFDCPSCGETSEVDVPMGTEFFWPSGG